MALKYTAFVDPNYTTAERRQLGIEIVNYIVDRTKNGNGINNKPFKSKYSQNYVKTADFKIAGKDPSDVNLTLSGDMLDSVEVLDVSIVGKIVIGFSSDNEEKKAEWLEEKGYRFLGLSDKELQSIISDFGAPENDTAPSDISNSLVESFVRGIFGR